MSVDRNAIVIEKIVKSFGHNVVLKGVTGNISKNSTVGLLGRNGEGKTTLFKIILDILGADSGKIQVLGQPPDGSSKIRKITGYVPERPSFHSFMTVSEVFRFRQKLFPSWDSAYMQEMIRDLELEGSTPIRGASKGTLAKTAWICATAHRPEVLLLDEPISGLDPIVRDSLLSRSVREQSEGKAIFIASHHMEEWLKLLDEIWILSKGVVSDRYRIDDLRENAVRITGKLKDPSIPLDLAVYEEFRNGNLVQWLTVDPEARNKIQASAIFDQMDAEPLPLESALKLLLQKEASNVR